jgi:hypothetical protein
MAAERPFRVSPSTTHKGNGTTSAEEKPLPLPGELIKQSRDGGQRIPRPSEHTQENVGHGHSPRIPWPKDNAVDHKPFKVKE